MTRVRQIAILSPRPEKLARFYTEVLGLKEVARSNGHVFLSDGHINLALLSLENNGTGLPGVNHLGFLVANQEETKRLVLSLEGRPTVREQPAPFDTPYPEIQFRDPDGVIFGASEQDWGISDETKGPKIRHLAVMTRDTERLARFYTQALNLHEVIRRGSNAVYLSDGYINLAFILTRGNVQPGPNHIGFLVEDVEEMRQRLLSLEGDLKVIPDELPNVQGLLFVEHKFRDPEGFVFDISDTGWATTKEEAAEFAARAH